ncbi:MAG: sensor domain-containing diguanylate cyclase [Candidatus Brocadiales bacterium]|nr:sensor domain-containing diguanylate cyclase [Candidatus Brocadiales bacterium]
MPGRVWLNGKPLWIADIHADTNFPRASIASRSGLHGAIAFPALNESEVLDVIGFFSREIKQPDNELLDMLHALCSQIGQFIKKAEVLDMLKHIAYHDTLTTLPNRMLFQDRLRVAMYQAKRNKQSVAVVLIDLDDFKDVNDTLGHFAGDLLLKDVAKRLKRCTRESDTVARMGGDEFVFILQNIKHIRDAGNVIQKILKILDSPFKINGHEIRTRASIGASLYPQDTDDPEILLEYADIAMYQSKKDGKSTYRFYTATNK